jgi:hypothetical protein
MGRLFLFAAMSRMVLGHTDSNSAGTGGLFLRGKTARARS